MSIKKQFLKSKPVCKVAFRLDATEANGAKKVQILGDFNNWDATAEPMNMLKSNDFTATLELETGKIYQFRYFVDGFVWKNDLESDSFQVNEFGTENGIISTLV